MQIIIIPFSNNIKSINIFFLLAVYLYFLSQTSIISMLSMCVRMPQITAASPLCLMCLFRLYMYCTPSSGEQILHLCARSCATTSLAAPRRPIRPCYLGGDPYGGRQSDVDGITATLVLMRSSLGLMSDRMTVRGGPHGSQPDMQAEKHTDMYEQQHECTSGACKSTTRTA